MWSLPANTFISHLHCWKWIRPNSLAQGSHMSPWIWVGTEHWWNNNWQVKTAVAIGRFIVPFCPTHPTWIILWLNADLCGQNCLSYGTACFLPFPFTTYIWPQRFIVLHVSPQSLRNSDEYFKWVSWLMSGRVTSFVFFESLWLCPDNYRSTTATFSSITEPSDVWKPRSSSILTHI